MKQYKYLYQKMLNRDLIREAYYRLRKGKTKRVEIKLIDANLEEEIECMYQMILNTKPVEVEHPELRYKPKHRTPKVIKEHGKERKIYMPEIHEQWLHHIIALILEPIITRTAYAYSCGSFPGRGAHYAKRRLEKWIRTEDVRYFAKVDIRHFYDSIRHDVLMKELAIRIKDDWFLYIIKLCLKGFNRGIPLGFYISQWLANYILEPLDYFILGMGFKVFERYMDDVVIMGSNKRKLRAAVVEIAKLLGRRFRLKLKRTYQVAKFIYKGKGRPIDYMGFVFYRDRTIIRKRIMIAATRMARKFVKRKRWYKSNMQAMISYIGWFSCTDSYNCYLERIKPFVNIGKLKMIISRLDRKEKQDERMEKRALCIQAG